MTLPTDELFKDQWHLQNTVTGQYDLDVVKVWDDYTGKGVRVVVMDSGIDYTHPDLAPNYDSGADFDFGQRDDDPSPTNTTANESHGTAVAGIIGAARNGTGVVGVAYDSTLIGYRIEYTALQLDKDAWVKNYADAMHDVAAKDVDIVNMSFGFWELYGTYFSDAQRQTQLAALDNAVDTGRDGLGAIMVKSAGNDRGNGVNENYSMVSNDTKQIIVAAANRDGSISSYSTYGAPILVSGFGSPMAGEVVTTDRLGANGYDATDYTHAFSGTSAAAPMVSGIVALMLQANPDLGWRDVQTILSVTARHVGPPVDGTTTGSGLFPWSFNGAATWNGGGMHYSEDYGYGLVDGLGAVRLSESWTPTPATSSNEKSMAIDLLSGTETVPDGDLEGTTYAAKAASGLLVERVTVEAGIDLERVGDFEIYITGPDGRERLLSADADDGDPDFYGASLDFTFHSQAFRGEDSKGAWSVRVVDDQTGEAVKVSDITITLFGSAAKNDTYFYTDEFSDYAGIGNHSTMLKDTDGGNDTLNAAAVTSAMTVDLNKGTGKIDGIAMKIAGIENIDGGDGNDRLTGSKAGNDLSGGRGADILTGGKGDDNFIFHTVADSLFGKLHDVIMDFAQRDDDIDLSDIDTSAKDGDQSFKFIGGKGFHEKAGELNFAETDVKGTRHDRTMIEADLDGDGKADFQIELAGLHALVRSDFIL